MFRVYHLISTLILLVVAESALANSYYIPLGKNKRDIGAGVLYYFDESSEKVLADIQALDAEEFQTYQKSTLNFGYTKANVWMKFTLKNPLQKRSSPYLVINYPLLDKANVYVEKRDGTFKKYVNGDLYPFSKRSISYRGFVVPLRFQSKEAKTIYLQVASSSSLLTPVSLWQRKAFFGFLAQEKMMHGLYYGCILAILAYNFFIFIFTRSKSYGTYVIFLAASALFYLAWTGVGTEYLWGESTWMTQRAFPLTGSLLALSVVVFQYFFLAIKNTMPRLNKFYYFLFLVYSTSLILAVTMPIEVIQPVCVALGVLSVVIAFAVSLYAMAKGSRPALFFTVAWSVFIGFIILGGIAASGFIDLGDDIQLLANYGSQFGSALEAILLSIGLADRINTMRRKEAKQTQKILAQAKEIEIKSEETRKSQEALIKFQEDSIEKLDQQVKERTKEIRDILEHIELGIFTFDENFVIAEEHSTHLNQLLGNQKFAGTDVRQSIFSQGNVSNDKLAMMENSFFVSFGTDVDLGWEANNGNVIHEMDVVMPDQAVKTISMEFDVILDEDTEEVNRFLVSLKDVTYLKGLESEAAEKSLENQILLEMLSNELTKTKRFIDRTVQTEKELGIYLPNIHNDDDAYAMAYRIFHTVKGNARSLGFQSIAELIHEIEDLMPKLKSKEIDKQDFDLKIQDFYKYIDRFDVLYQDKFAPLKLQSDAKSEDHDVKAFFHDYLMPGVKEISATLEKPTPDIHVNNPDGFSFGNEDLSDLFFGIFNHILRNSLDHGIEIPIERERIGKPIKGKVTVNLSEKDSCQQILIRDDGAGLNMTKLRSKMKTVPGAPPPTMEQIAELVFSSQLSTAETVSSISGRGVGMDAVRNDLRSIGGAIYIHLLITEEELTQKKLQSPEHDLKIPFEFEIVLPLGTFHANPKRLDQSS
ncbi:MAG: Hpt domain-containing protein [Pseudobacteriovorax sp.]|nr:Hpt domain-containing protein [Pseudobacteriovorax sp.]